MLQNCNETKRPTINRVKLCLPFLKIETTELITPKPNNITKYSSL